MHWAVQVWRDGEQVVTIEKNMLAGRDIGPEDEEAIRTSAHHLLAFIGDQAPDVLRALLAEVRQQGSGESVRCPFCHDDGYDPAGLKLHLSAGWCEAFDATEMP